MMSSLTGYIQPLTLWIHNHPNWALLVAFTVSFSESLPFIGSIIPGSVTMTAIGILAGAGVMRIDLSLLSTILGAISGDFFSYGLGRIFSDRLPSLWPFSRYPKWLDYGKNYFNRHGGKSVLIGRFIGPIRSIIPIIAGMMGMNRWYFIVVNVASAMVWATIYMMPGILIGTASSELSTESASRLFMLILFLLISVWLITLGIKWGLTLVNQWLHTYLNSAWHSLLKNRAIGRFISYITPKYTTDYYGTAVLSLLFLFCLILVPLTIFETQHVEWIKTLNMAIDQFCLSIRTRDFDIFFIVIRLDISYLSLFSLGLSFMIYALYHRDWRILLYWLALILVSSLTTNYLAQFIPVPSPSHKHIIGSLFLSPVRELAIATALISFLIFYISAFYKQFISVALCTLLLSALICSGIALIYLSEEWFTNVIIAYLIGFTISLAHWILYYRRGKPRYRSYLPITLSIMLLIIATALSSSLYFEKISENQQPYTKQYVIRHQAWWQQQSPVLPLYSSNRFGKEMGLLNIQYAGSIQTLQKELESAGWVKQRDSFLYSLLLRFNNKSSSASLPLMAQLYLSKKPYVIMTYGPASDKNSLIIRFWRSNYHLNNRDQIIWIGSLQHQYRKHRVEFKDPIPELTRLLTHYKTKTITLKASTIRIPHVFSPRLLLLESDENETSNTTER